MDLNKFQELEDDDKISLYNNFKNQIVLQHTIAAETITSPAGDGNFEPIHTNNNESLKEIKEEEVNQ